MRKGFAWFAAVAAAGLIGFLLGWRFGPERPERIPLAAERVPIGADAPAKPERDEQAGDVANALRERVASETTPATEGIGFSLPAGQLLAAASSIEDEAERQVYLKALLDHWFANDRGISDRERDLFLAGVSVGDGRQPFGFEVELSSYAAKLSDPALREAWKEQFADHPARAEIYARFLSRDLLSGPPQSILAASAGWTEWEQGYFRGKVLSEWAWKDPRAAFDWGRSQPDGFGAGERNRLLDVWAHQDFAGLSAYATSTVDESFRTEALKALAKQRARSGTAEAVDWANRLPSEADQRLAFEVLYRETPRGVGAVVRMKSGFPEVVEPIVENGLQAGDLIVSAQEQGRRSRRLFGSNLSNAIGALTGKPGSVVELQVMRRDPKTGEYRQQAIAITRQQLWIEDGESEK